MDSTGTPIFVGDMVKWRGRRYTIKAFGAATGALGTHVIEFEEEPLHIVDANDIPCEIGVDLVCRADLIWKERP